MADSSDTDVIGRAIALLHDEYAEVKTRPKSDKKTLELLALEKRVQEAVEAVEADCAAQHQELQATIAELSEQHKKAKEALEQGYDAHVEQEKHKQDPVFAPPNLDEMHRTMFNWMLILSAKKLFQDQ